MANSPLASPSILTARFSRSKWWRARVTARSTAAPRPLPIAPRPLVASARPCAARRTRSGSCRVSSSRVTKRSKHGSRPSEDLMASGAMDRYCVMGNPVAHSRSPWIHARFAELTGQTLHYGKRHIARDGFAAAVHAFAAAGGLGCNITTPFKFEGAALATRISERATLARASNILTFKDGAILADNRSEERRVGKE